MQRSKFLFYVLFSFLLNKSFSQDTLFLRNGEYFPAKTIKVEEEMVRLKKTNESHSPTYFYHKDEISFIKYYDGVIVYYDLARKPSNSSKYYYYPRLSYKKKNFFSGPEPGRKITLEKILIYTKDLSSEKKVPNLEKLTSKLKRYDKRDKIFSTIGFISMGLSLLVTLEGVSAYTTPDLQFGLYVSGASAFVIGFGLESGSIINKIKKHIVSKEAVKLYNAHRDNP